MLHLVYSLCSEEREEEMCQGGGGGIGGKTWKCVVKIEK